MGEGYGCRAGVTGRERVNEREREKEPTVCSGLKPVDCQCECVLLCLCGNPRLHGNGGYT